jgi:hypothetical protein
MAMNITSDFHNEIWNFSYREILNNYNYIYNFEGDNYENLKAIAEIMMVYHFQILVDTYGDIPFDEALQGIGNIKPSYNDDAYVYEQLLAMATEAVDMINNAPNTAIIPTASQDVMLHGDMEMWKKFGNTLKLKLLLRQSEVMDASTITSHLDNILAEGSGFLGSGESVYCNPNYSDATDSKMNEFWEGYGANSAGTITLNWKYTKATDYIIDKMIFTNNDFRVDGKFALPENGGLWSGFPQGAATAGEDNEDYSGIGRESLDTYAETNFGTDVASELKGPEQDSHIFTASESLLLQAEAVQRGYMGGDAETLYREGVISSFDEYDLDTTFSVDSYLDANGGNDEVDFSVNPMKAIAYQKYYHLIGINGFEAWFEYRRTGYPDDLPLSSTAIESDRPVRLLYPTSEISNNSSNVPAQTNNDAFASKVFWDQ